MRFDRKELLLSAGDLNAFLGCHHAVVLSRQVQDGDLLVAGSVDPTLEHLQRRSLEHKAAVLAKMEVQGLKVKRIPEKESLQARVDATVEAMREGAQAIYQPALARGHWRGSADLLRRVDGSLELGNWLYEVVDIKLAVRAKVSHVIQLSIFADLVEAEQGVPPPALRVKLANDREEVLNPADFVHYTRLAGRRLEEFIHSGAVGTAAEPCGYCGLCTWASHCKVEWEKADHLTLVANIRGSQMRKLRADGVTTLAALATLPENHRVQDMVPETLAKLRAQASLQYRARSEGRCHEVLEPPPGRGFARLPQPDRGDVFFDMEGDPLFPDGGLEYLFGAHVVGQEFRTFWAHDRAEEKRAFEDFMKFLAAQMKKHPGAYVYHYNHYEPTALKRLAMRHGTCEAPLDDLLRRRRFVDLYSVVREQLRLSEPRYSLKNVERFYRDKRDGEVETAADSIVAYERYCETGDKDILTEIEQYNKIDCVSTAGLRDWLLRLRPDNIPWFDPTLDQEPQKQQQEAEAEHAKIIAALLNNVSETERPYRTLVAELCEFHRREQKPQWWAMYDRMERDDEELITDADCLGALQAVEQSRQEKQSWMRAYTFPVQDTKLRVGDRPTIAATMEPAGSIEELDLDKCRVVLKRGKMSGDLPDTLSLGPAKPYNDGVLRAAVRRFANSVVRGYGRFRAVESILRRELPRIKGRMNGAPILDQGEEPVAGAARTTTALEKSHLFIQGPPGTGKTYTASRAAVALMQQGKRVGIASNSHKAINNLLEAIEVAAKDVGFKFMGVKKASDNPDQVFNGTFIKTVTSNDDVGPNLQLIAGTAWLFSREEQELAVDTLFVDEAGQVSLANLVAMGTAAHNIVLVGDQQQLGQPIQGVHPEGTGVNVLEHLLQGTATVPPERGIFLDVSFRMHPNLCGWVSDTIYDGRLKPHCSTSTQKLLLPPNAPAPLAPHGLRFLPVTHTGRSQICPEEAKAVEELWLALMDHEWIDRHGARREIGPEDVLVVAPYNLQVNLIRKTLPANARVGTVDKFQGQEAPVVLVSLATSSGDDLPRDVAFLFSRNRLNVAVSRAKCLAVVLASPLLLAVPCRKVDELALVNTLCSAVNWNQGDGLTTNPASEPSWRQAADTGFLFTRPGLPLPGTGHAVHS